MVVDGARASDDTAALRKARGAFFTPRPITRFIADWALRSPEDTVLEPSSGDAAFLVAAVDRLKSIGADRPVVDGVEIHPHSAAVGARRIEAAGGEAHIEVSDFFLVDAAQKYDAVMLTPTEDRATFAN